jgi:hypothetical protein
LESAEKVNENEQMQAHDNKNEYSCQIECKRGMGQGAWSKGERLNTGGAVCSVEAGKAPRIWQGKRTQNMTLGKRRQNPHGVGSGNPLQNKG